MLTRMKMIAATAAMTFAAAAMPATARTVEGFESGSFGPNWTDPTAERTSAAAAHDGALGLVSNFAWHYDTTDTVATGDTLSSWFEFTSSGRAYLGFGATAAGASSFVLAPNTGQIMFQNNDAYGYASLNSTPFVFALNDWYRATVTFGSSVVGKVYGSDGTTLLASLTASGLDHGTGGIALRGFQANIDTIAIDSPAAAAVPEPASWAMLMVGLGAIGVALRSARRRSDEKFDAKIRRMTAGAPA